MMIPTRFDFTLKILDFLKHGETYSLQDTTKNMLSRYPNLSDEEKTKITKIAKRKIFDNEVSFAVSHLKHAGLIESVKFGSFRITILGKNLIKNPPEKITEKYLRQHYPKYNEWVIKSKDKQLIRRKKEKDDLKEKFGVVLFIDILGIKGKWKSEDAKTIRDNWNEFNQKLEQYLRREMTNIDLHISSFSDTVIITLEHDDVNYILKKLGESVWISIVDSIKLDLPLRGCFALGKFHRKENFYIGEAIDEASQYYELPQWIGISASPSAHYAIEELLKTDPGAVEQNYTKHLLPLKQSIEQDAWVINWPFLLDEDLRLYSRSDSNFKEILTKIELKLSTMHDISASQKWRNTKQFVKSYMGEL